MSNWFEMLPHPDPISRSQSGSHELSVNFVGTVMYMQLFCHSVIHMQPSSESFTCSPSVSCSHSAPFVSHSHAALLSVVYIQPLCQSFTFSPFCQSFTCSPSVSHSHAAILSVIHMQPFCPSFTCNPSVSHSHAALCQSFTCNPSVSHSHSVIYVQLLIHAVFTFHVSATWTWYNTSVAVLTHESAECNLA